MTFWVLQISLSAYEPSFHGWRVEGFEDRVDLRDVHTSKLTDNCSETITRGISSVLEFLLLKDSEGRSSISTYLVCRSELCCPLSEGLGDERIPRVARTLLVGADGNAPCWQDPELLLSEACKTPEMSPSEFPRPWRGIADRPNCTGISSILDPNGSSIPGSINCNCCSSDELCPDCSAQLQAAGKGSDV